MKIGIIIFSQTGNTLSVGRQVQQSLKQHHSDVEIEQIKITDDKIDNQGKFSFEYLPDVTTYDYLIFGTFVMAFSLNPVMRAFMKQLPEAVRKKCDCFVTQAFPYAWLGGTRAIKQLTTLCSHKSLSVMSTHIINWNNRKRDNMIQQLLDDIRPS